MKSYFEIFQIRVKYFRLLVVFSIPKITYQNPLYGFGGHVLLLRVAVKDPKFHQLAMLPLFFSHSILLCNE